ncbi:MAG: hypothetical protein DMG94_12850, partial [Acidobacteria bacterium]
MTLIAACVAAVQWGFQQDSINAEFFGRRAHSAPKDVSALASFQPSSIQSRNRRLVYPYSIVPGGIASVAELHQAADHDAVVGEHYQGFDYSRARVIEVKEPRLVYLSYRRHNKVYWSRKQASLHKGETLLTDGKIT